ncbi:unnamed protein product [Litomosoides sigmodontis]|uniref:Uncharacterized protein n=1 Tax=Litomosoides sigmodontis TaxID=42156 RepID=A0A3P6SJ81_LITSI|nr:unnamed protein product [Litomosoides sigmodontis]
MDRNVMMGIWMTRVKRKREVKIDGEPVTVPGWRVAGSDASKITATATTLLLPLPPPPLPPQPPPPPPSQAITNAGTTAPQHQFSIRRARNSGKAPDNDDGRLLNAANCITLTRI